MSEEVILEERAIEFPIEKFHDLVVAGSPMQGESRQADDETPEDAIRPPIDLDQLARLSQISQARKSIIDAIARNTVGLGYSISVLEGTDERQLDPEEEQTIRRKLEAAAARDVRLDSPSFGDLLYAVKTDEEECGNGYIEVSRDKRTGQIDGLFHAPGKRVRRLKDRKGFVLLGPSGMPDEGVRFLNFGHKIRYDGEGLPTNRLADGANWQTNELLPFRLYSSESRDYGLPRDVGMVMEYLGEKLAKESNISFFDSSGTPPTLIFVQGEESRDGQGRTVFRVKQDTADRIANLLKSDSGHRHRVAIIPLPPGAKTSQHTLGQISERDMGFTNYRADIRKGALGAFRVAPIFISEMGEAGRYTAEVERALTLEQVFDPEQRRYENRLRLIINDMGHAQRGITFKRLAVEADAARRESAERMAETGTITNGEFRKAHGWPPLPEAAEGEEPGPGQVPFGWHDQLVNTGKPDGAENRTMEAESQQGLRPGIGARRRRQATDYSAGAEGGAASLAVGAKAAGRTATQRAVRAARNGNG